MILDWWKKGAGGRKSISVANLREYEHYILRQDTTSTSSMHNSQHSVKHILMHDCLFRAKLLSWRRKKPLRWKSIWPRFAAWAAKRPCGTAQPRNVSSSPAAAAWPAGEPARARLPLSSERKSRGKQRRSGGGRKQGSGGIGPLTSSGIRQRACHLVRVFQRMSSVNADLALRADAKPANLSSWGLATRSNRPVCR